MGYRRIYLETCFKRFNTKHNEVFALHHDGRLNSDINRDCCKYVDELRRGGLYPFSVNFIPLVGDYAGQHSVGCGSKGV